MQRTAIGTIKMLMEDDVHVRSCMVDYHTKRWSGCQEVGGLVHKQTIILRISFDLNVSKSLDSLPVISTRRGRSPEISSSQLVKNPTLWFNNVHNFRCLCFGTHATVLDTLL